MTLIGCGDSVYIVRAMPDRSVADVKMLKTSGRALSNPARAFSLQLLNQNCKKEQILFLNYSLLTLYTKKIRQL